MKNVNFLDMEPCGFVRTKRSASVIKTKIISELGTILAVTNNRSIEFVGVDACEVATEELEGSVLGRFEVSERYLQINVCQ
jgi:hypothetical protein